MRSPNQVKKENVKTKEKKKRPLPPKVFFLFSIFRKRVFENMTKNNPVYIPSDFEETEPLYSYPCVKHRAPCREPRHHIPCYCPKDKTTQTQTEGNRGNVSRLNHVYIIIGQKGWKFFFTVRCNVIAVFKFVSKNLQNNILFSKSFRKYKLVDKNGVEVFNVSPQNHNETFYIVEKNGDISNNKRVWGGSNSGDSADSDTDISMS